LQVGNFWNLIMVRNQHWMLYVFFLISLKLWLLEYILHTGKILLFKWMWERSSEVI